MSGDRPPVPVIAAPPRRLAAMRGEIEARIALGRSGAGLPTRAAQAFLLDHAQAREAVWSALDVGALVAGLGGIGLAARHVRSGVDDRAAYLRRPDLGRRLRDEDRDALAAMKRGGDVAIVIADGLSATAVERNALRLVAALRPLLEKAGFTLQPVIVATHGRVALADDIGVATGAEATVILIGERPGLSAADSLGAYLTYAPARGLPDSRRNCISNIRDGGLSVEEAAAQIAALLRAMRRQGTSGVALAAPEGLLEA